MKLFSPEEICLFNMFTTFTSESVGFKNDTGFFYMDMLEITRRFPTIKCNKSQKQNEE